MPVHYQEPFRRGYDAGWRPSADDFLTDLEQARSGGAAGWCFHDGDQRGAADGRPRRSFDLRDGPLFKQLDAEERRFMACLAGARSSHMERIEWIFSGIPGQRNAIAATNHCIQVRGGWRSKWQSREATSWLFFDNSALPSQRGRRSL